MVAIAKYLYAISYSEFYKKEDWQGWADDQIMKKDPIEMWIYDVSLANTFSELREVLNNKMIDEDYHKIDTSPITDAILGYYFLMYKDNKLSPYVLLEKSGDAVDNGSGASEDCEFFYEKLNEIDRNQQLLHDKGYLKMIDDIYVGFMGLALSQKQIIENY